MKKLLTFIFAALFSVTAMAAAHSGKSQSQASANLPSFSQADANGDQILTWKEAKAAGIPQKLFKSEDFDHNKEITKAMYNVGLRDWQKNHS